MPNSAANNRPKGLKMLQVDIQRDFNHQENTDYLPGIAYIIGI
jgi:hypothetical protein